MWYILGDIEAQDAQWLALTPDSGITHKPRDPATRMSLIADDGKDDPAVAARWRRRKRL
jgi:hypothetical protein